MKGRVRDEDGAADAVLAAGVEVLEDELELAGADALVDPLEVDEELELGAGELPLELDELGVVEASGSTYC